MGVALLAALAAGCGCHDGDRNGTYKGPSEALVVVTGGAVTKLQLRYAGNMGFAFASGLIGVEGSWAIDGDSFTIHHPQATVQGHFDGNCKVEGTWTATANDAAGTQIVGDWHADK
jgi:hypothetical protein